jgi:hypothetical protein
LRLIRKASAWEYSRKSRDRQASPGEGYKTFIGGVPSMGL